MKKICLKTVTYRIASPKIPDSFDGYRLAVLADLHDQVPGGDIRFLPDVIRREHPDAILLAGDMITEEKHFERRVFFGYAFGLMQGLRRIAPVFYGMGNHEARWERDELPHRGSFVRYRRALREEGIVFLENESVFLRKRDAAIRLTGLSLPVSCYSKRKQPHVSGQTIRKLAGSADPAHFQILLAHTPQFFDAYMDWGADLALAGHFHGGVIRLPGLGGVISTTFRLFPKYDHGRYRRGSGEMIVSSGLGSHTIPIRINNPPELVILVLKKERKIHGTRI